MSVIDTFQYQYIQHSPQVQHDSLTPIFVGLAAAIHRHGLAFPWIPGPEPKIRPWLSAVLKGGMFSGWTVVKTDFLRTCQLDKRA